ncbi:MAG: hypothetical protein CMJ83_13915 [Planctomycetes bacterium]|nr:hypothetical protein [Planctomycetota bacterium]
MFAPVIRTALATLLLSGFLTGQGSVSFRVLDGDDAVVKSAQGRVLVLGEDANGDSIVVGHAVVKDGRTQPMKLSSGDYEVELGLEGRMIGYESITVTAGEQIADFYVPGTGLLLTGVVLEAAGRPVNAGTRFVVTLTRAGDPFEGQGWTTFEVEVVCDADGRWMFGLPSPGPHTRLRLELEEVTTRGVPVAPGTTYPVLMPELRVKPGSNWDIGTLLRASIETRKTNAGSPGCVVEFVDHLLLPPEKVTITLRPNGEGDVWAWSSEAVPSHRLALSSLATAIRKCGGDARLEIDVPGASWSMAIPEQLPGVLVLKRPRRVTVSGVIVMPVPRLRGRITNLVLRNLETGYHSPLGIQLNAGTFQAIVEPGSYDVLLTMVDLGTSLVGTVHIGEDAPNVDLGRFLALPTWSMAVVQVQTDDGEDTFGLRAYTSATVPAVHPGPLIEVVGLDHVVLAAPPGLDGARVHLHLESRGYLPLVIPLDELPPTLTLSRPSTLTVDLRAWKAEIAGTQLELAIAARAPRGSGRQPVRVAVETFQGRQRAVLKLPPGTWSLDFVVADRLKRVRRIPLGDVTLGQDSKDWIDVPASLRTTVRAVLAELGG